MFSTSQIIVMIILILIGLDLPRIVSTNSESSKNINITSSLSFENDNIGRISAINNYNDDAQHDDDDDDGKKKFENNEKSIILNEENIDNTEQQNDSVPQKDKAFLIMGITNIINNLMGPPAIPGITDKEHFSELSINFPNVSLNTTIGSNNTLTGGGIKHPQKYEPEITSHEKIATTTKPALMDSFSAIFKKTFGNVFSNKRPNKDSTNQQQEHQQYLQKPTQSAHVVQHLQQQHLVDASKPIHSQQPPTQYLPLQSEKPSQPLKPHKQLIEHIEQIVHQQQQQQQQHQLKIDENILVAIDKNVESEMHKELTKDLPYVEGEPKQNELSKYIDGTEEKSADNIESQQIDDTQLVNNQNIKTVNINDKIPLRDDSNEEISIYMNQLTERTNDLVKINDRIRNKIKDLLTLMRNTTKKPDIKPVKPTKPIPITSHPEVYKTTEFPYAYITTTRPTTYSHHDIHSSTQKYHGFDYDYQKVDIQTTHHNGPDLTTTKYNGNDYGLTTTRRVFYNKPMASNNRHKTSDFYFEEEPTTTTTTTTTTHNNNYEATKHRNHKNEDYKQTRDDSNDEEMSIYMNQLTERTNDLVKINDRIRNKIKDLLTLMRNTTKKPHIKPAKPTKPIPTPSHSEVYKNTELPYAYITTKRPTTIYSHQDIHSSTQKYHANDYGLTTTKQTKPMASNNRHKTSDFYFEEKPTTTQHNKYEATTHGHHKNEDYKHTTLHPELHKTTKSHNYQNDYEITKKHYERPTTYSNYEKPEITEKPIKPHNNKYEATTHGHHKNEDYKHTTLHPEMHKTTKLHNYQNDYEITKKHYESSTNFNNKQNEHITEMNKEHHGIPNNYHIKSVQAKSSYHDIVTPIPYEFTEQESAE